MQNIIDKSKEFTPTTVISHLAEKFGFGYLDDISFLRDVKPSQELLSLLPADKALSFNIVPLSETDKEIVVLCSSYVPTILDEIFITTRKKAKVILTEAAPLAGHISRIYQDVGFSTDIVSLEAVADVEPIDEISIRQEAESAPIVQQVNAILHGAFFAKASDIHLDPLESGLQVRYRVNGTLIKKMIIPEGSKKAVTACLKLKSQAQNVAEKKKAQDGRFKLVVGDKSIDCRVNFLPTVNGEKINVRLLDPSTFNVDLQSIFGKDEYFANFRRLMHSASGLILVTGPTGSGKTTTLYSAIRSYDSEKNNIITVEDPVEYHMPGINQVQVNEKKGQTFEECLKNILRQDPNIIMIGEVRDKPTAMIAPRAATTGHLVYATLHTNSSLDAIDRMESMGAERFLLLDTVLAVLAQRLLRRQCPHCLAPYTPDFSILPQERIDEIKGMEFMKSTGCEHCGGTGISGRVPVFELLTMDDETRQLFQTKSASAVRSVLREKGFRTLWDHGLEYVKKSEVTIEELALHCK